MLTSLFQWLHWLKNCPPVGRSRPHPPRRAVARWHSFIPRLDFLEDRTVPTTFTVSNLADSGAGSLRSAIMAANSNPGADAIQFAPGLKGTITLHSELNITDNLTIKGSGANQLTVSGHNATRVFDVSGNINVSIDDLTIANGLESVTAGPAFGGGLLNFGASVSLSNVVFANNKAEADGGYAGGGAVANLAGAHLTANQTDFLNNTASGAASNYGNGGAVYDDDLHTIVDIEHSTFAGNLASGGEANGGAIGHYGGSLTLANCSFDGNQALALPPGSDAFGLNAAGGAIESDDAGSGFFELGIGITGVGQPTMTITHCSFTNNLAHAVAATDGNDGAQTQGGAMDVDDGAKATVSDSIFADNSAIGGDGGAGSAGSDGGAGGRTPCAST